MQHKPPPLRTQISKLAERWVPYEPPQLIKQRRLRSETIDSFWVDSSRSLSPSLNQVPQAVAQPAMQSQQLGSSTRGADQAASSTNTNGSTPTDQSDPAVGSLLGKMASVQLDPNSSSSRQGEEPDGTAEIDQAFQDKVQVPPVLYQTGPLRTQVTKPSDNCTPYKLQAAKQERPPSEKSQFFFVDSSSSESPRLTQVLHGTALPVMQPQQVASSAPDQRDQSLASLSNGMVAVQLDATSSSGHHGEKPDGTTGLGQALESLALESEANFAQEQTMSATSDGSGQTATNMQVGPAAMSHQQESTSKKVLPELDQALGALALEPQTNFGQEQITSATLDESGQTAATMQVGPAAVSSQWVSTSWKVLQPQPEDIPDSLPPLRTERGSLAYARYLLKTYPQIFAGYSPELQTLIRDSIKYVRDNKVSYTLPDVEDKIIPVDSIGEGFKAGVYWNISQPFQPELDKKGGSTETTDFYNELRDLTAGRERELLVPFARDLLQRGVRPVDLIGNRPWLLKNLFNVENSPAAGNVKTVQTDEAKEVKAQPTVWKIDNVKLDDAYRSGGGEGIEILPESPEIASRIQYLTEKLYNDGCMLDVQQVMAESFSHNWIYGDQIDPITLFQDEVLRKSGYCPENEHEEFRRFSINFEDCINEYFQVKDEEEGSIDFPSQAMKNHCDAVVKAVKGIFRYMYPRSFGMGDAESESYPIGLESVVLDDEDDERQVRWELALAGEGEDDDEMVQEAP